MTTNERPQPFTTNGDARQHPFYVRGWGDRHFFAVTADDRIRAIRQMQSVEQLRACLHVQDLQKTAERAAQVRLKKLEKAQS